MLLWLRHPEGYRKALQKMKLAAKFHLPIICLIDTPGAYPGIGAEERGQAQLIATSILEMSRLATPIVCVVIGEGGSGGALGIGIGDRVSLLEHAYYSVISPEGCRRHPLAGGRRDAPSRGRRGSEHDGQGPAAGSASSTTSSRSRSAAPTATRARSAHVEDLLAALPPRGTEPCADRVALGIPLPQVSQMGVFEEGLGGEGSFGGNGVAAS